MKHEENWIVSGLGMALSFVMVALFVGLMVIYPKAFLVLFLIVGFIVLAGIASDVFFDKWSDE